MRSAEPLAVLVLTGFVAAGVACGNGDDTFVPPAPIPDAAVDATRDAAKGADAALAADVEAGTLTVDATEPADAISPLVAIRFANWSSDAPPVDFCLAPHGTTTFEGPLLAGGAAATVEAGVTDAGLAGAFPTVSSYLLVTPGQYDARLVTAGATDCSGKIGDDATNLPALLAGGAATIALIGVTHPIGDAGNARLQMVGFVDDTFATNVAVRFINATSSLPTVDVGKGSGASFTRLFAGVRFGYASTLTEAQDAKAKDASTPIVDLNGYWLSTAALTSATFSARVAAAGDAGPTDLSVATLASAAIGTIVTLAILPPSPGATNPGSPQILRCFDNAGTVGPLASCETISQ